MNPPDKRHLLQQIAAITAMERGKLSSYSPNDGPEATGPYHKLQRWEGGDLPQNLGFIELAHKCS